jgi:integrase/recombinase XerD
MPWFEEPSVRMASEATGQRDMETKNELTQQPQEGQTVNAEALSIVPSQPSRQPPSLILDAGDSARFAWEEFLFGCIRNPHTRRSYERTSRHFLRWCDKRNLPLRQIAPADVGHYLDSLPAAIASKKVYLAALRQMFDLLVTRHAVGLNPAASVRTERHQVIEGKTPEISVAQARLLLSSINTSHVVGLRDRAIIATMIYTAARVGAVANLKRYDFYDAGDQFCLRFLDKGGKSREIPVRHDLQRYLFAYLDAARLFPANKDSPLFRTTVRRTRTLTQSSMTAGDVSRMVKRRLRDANLPNRISSHSMRVATVTDLLESGVPLEDVQYLAGHSDPRTTRLYDRRHKRVTRNIVERISI